MKTTIGLLLVGILLAACASPEHQPVQRMGAPLPYKLESPDKVFSLPSELDEISGLTALGDGKLACIQDEKGIIFTYDLEREAVIQELNFENDGDYEGLAVVGEAAYVLESDGDLFRIDNFRNGGHTATKFETELDKSHNTEGLVYDAANKRLLIACKDNPGRSYPGMKAIYAFDVQAGALSMEPAFLIDAKAIEDSLIRRPRESLSRDITNFLKGEHDPSILRPSGLAIHPHSQDIYILSHPNRMLVVLDKEGLVKHIHVFKNTHYRQPESLTFDAEGNLYIGNESNGGPSNILMFKPHE